jgi:hypothetical protein
MQYQSSNTSSSHHPNTPLPHHFIIPLIVVKVEEFIFGKMKMNFFFQSFVNIEDNGTNGAVVNDINEFENKILFV